MKKYLLFLIALIIVPINVFASDEFINQNGVVMDIDNYNNLVAKLGYDYVNIMTQESYDDLKDHELPLVGYDEVTVNTYAGVPVIASPYSSNNTHITNSKSLSIMIFYYSTNNYYVQAVNQWTNLPAVRNYDVFAIRTEGAFNVIDTTQQGTQYYVNSSEGHSIIYQYNGANTVRKSNGFGMSMNLVNDSGLTNITNTITCHVSGGYGTVYASYQHATSWNITKAQSMSYSLEPTGLGGVIYYGNYAITSHYDGMAGVFDRINY